MSDLYRDRSEGSAARRQELLRRRRDELVTMPHAVRRVVVARSARIAAGMGATLAGVVLLAAAWSPSFAVRLASALPGEQPAPLSTVLFGAWLLGLITWAIARARVEHRFAVAMSRYVLPSNDVDGDVERLDHEHPDDIAREMGHQLEVRSAAWPILAVGVLVPATGLWFAAMLDAGRWPLSEFEGVAARHANLLAGLAAVGAIAAIALTRKAMRRPGLATLIVPASVVGAGLAILGVATHTEVAWGFAGVAGVATAIGVMARMLGRERALLEVDDPAAGSELFTLRGALAELRDGMVRVRAALLRLQRRHWAMLAAAAVLSAGVGLWSRPRTEAPTGSSMAALRAAASVESAPALVEPIPPRAGRIGAPPYTPYTFERVGTKFKLEVTLDDDGEGLVPMAGIAVVPRDWQAMLEVELVTSAPVGIVRDVDTALLAPTSARTHVRIDGCEGPRPLALHLVHGPARGTVKLSVTPRLTLADCRAARR